ncbi:signal peptidase I [Pilimelia terevasa]|uniref:Signal peptidase I n=1 Tax=Pilimelia terevasa TaxID=53372 RepID=A0A8J3BRJ7_9ACTN|nr:signal peptidase I [Pilimelia terevasa]GGK33180.1 signal peptidase I [Pilimelia terevasa]
MTPPADLPRAAAGGGRPRRRPRRWLAAGAAVAAGAALVLATRGVVAEPVRVESASMAPTLEVGQRVLMDKVSIRLLPPRRSELVVFRGPADGALTLKRVVGVAGDEVSIEDAQLVVNGAKVDEPYVDLASVDGLYYGPVRVPDGMVLVLGDNRAQSVDSRAYGPVPLDAVRGRVPSW